MWYIYAHKNLNNEIVYIGTGQKKRLGAAHYAKPTYSRIWSAYFKDFKPIVEILTENLTQDEAYLQENLAIKEFNPILNSRLGGKNGKYKIKVKKRKYVLKNPGDYSFRKKENHPMYGKKQTTTSKAQNASTNGRRPFLAIKLDCGIIFGPFFYQEQATTALNIPRNSAIGRCLSGQYETCHGFKFIEWEL